MGQPRHYRLLARLSWLLVLSIIAIIAGLVAKSQFFSNRNFELSAGEKIGINVSARMIVGLRPPSGQALSNLEQFNAGPLEQRYIHAVLIGEFAGPEKALDQFAKIDTAVESQRDDVASLSKTTGKFPSRQQLRLRRALGDLYRQFEAGDFDSTKLPERDRKMLTDELGWVGELALTPADSPDRTRRAAIQADARRLLIIVAAACFLGFLFILGGVLALVVLAGLFVARVTKSHFQNSSGHGYVYIETFAVWMVLFLALQLGGRAISDLTNNNLIAQIMVPVSFFGSLAALAWPMIRGLSFSTVCREIGWEIGNPLEEIFVGGFCYLALIVPLLFGIGLTVLLSFGVSAMQPQHEFESHGPAGHPIVEEIASGGNTTWIFAVLAACVAAPIVEETMFRGVLYRSLRDATGRGSRWISIALSSIVGGLMFAMIHPQGIVGVPALTTLAIGFSLVREWRNSLIGPMVMHGINNGLLMTFMFLVLS